MSRYYDLTQLCSHFYKIATELNKDRLLLIGDSLAVGLNNQLRQHAEAAGMPYRGKGVGGKTIWYWVNGKGRQWLNSQLASFRPSHVFISLGTNDAYTRMSAEQIAELTHKLNDIIRKAGASPMWVGAPTLPDRSAGVGIKRNLLDTIRGNAGHFFDSRKVPLPQSDKIHPTAKGYKQWSDEIWRWAITGEQRVAPQKTAPRRTVGLTSMKNSEVTPELSQMAVQILRKHRQEPEGTLFPFSQGGVQYVARISMHPPNSSNPTWHKGVDLHYPSGHIPGSARPAKPASTRKALTGTTAEGLLPLYGIERTTPEFRRRLIQIAEDLGIDPNWLTTVISFESGFNPRAANTGSSATGLIQWIASTAKNKYPDKFPANMTRRQVRAKIQSIGMMEQLEMIHKYFQPHKGRMHSLRDVYLAVYKPSLMRKPMDYVVARQGSKEYRLNKFDHGNKGYYTVGDVAASVQGRYNSARKRAGEKPQAETAKVERRKERKSTLQQILDYLFS